MGIVVYRREKENKLIHSVMDAFCKGLQNNGIDFEQRKEKDYIHSDVAVVFSQYKKKLHNQSKDRREIYRKHPYSKLLVLERGFINRSEYHSMGIGGVNGDAYFPVKEKGTISDRFDQLGVEIKPWNTEGDFILLVGQVPWDSTVQHIEYTGWVHETILRIRDITDKQIIWRPHPLQPTAVKISQQFKNVNNVIQSRNNLDIDLVLSSRVVTFCSNTSVDSLLVGKPTFVLSNKAVTKDIASRTLSSLSLPVLKQSRKLFFNRLAYCQWNIKELEQGEFLTVYKGLLNVL